MLTNQVDDLDLAEERDKLEPFLPEEVHPYYIGSNKETPISFPVEAVSDQNQKPEPG